jgi:hypothetical protein
VRTRLPDRARDPRGVARQVEAATQVPSPPRCGQTSLRAVLGRSTRSQATGRRRAPPRGAVGIARTREAPPPGCRRRREPPSGGGIPFRETARARSSARPTSPPPAHHLNAGAHRPARSARGHGRQRVHAASPLPTFPPHRGGRAGEPVTRRARPRPLPDLGRLPRALPPPPAPRSPPRSRRPTFLRAARAGNSRRRLSERSRRRCRDPRAGCAACSRSR